MSNQALPDATSPRITNALIARVMIQILDLAPMNESRTRFQQLANAGDPDAVWKLYEGCLSWPEMDTDSGSEEGQGMTSFRALKPAIEAVYRLKG